MPCETLLLALFREIADTRSRVRLVGVCVAATTPPCLVFPLCIHPRHHALIQPSPPRSSGVLPLFFFSRSRSFASIDLIAANQGPFAISVKMGLGILEDSALAHVPGKHATPWQKLSPLCWRMKIPNIVIL